MSQRPRVRAAKAAIAIITVRAQRYLQGAQRPSRARLVGSGREAGLPKLTLSRGLGGAEARPSRGEAPGSGTCCALAAPATMPGASPTSLQDVCPQDHPARRHHPCLRHRPGNWGPAVRTGLSKVKELGRGWRLRSELGPAWPEAWVHSGQGRPPPPAATTLASFLLTSRLMNDFSWVDAYLLYGQHLGQCLAQGWCLTSFLNG